MQLTKNEKEFIQYLLDKESKGLLSDVEVLLINSITKKLKPM